MDKIETVADLVMVFNKEDDNYLIMKKVIADFNDYKLGTYSYVDIAKIGYFDKANKPNIMTVADNLQNYIVDFSDYQHFIQLVDSAFDKLK